MALSGAMSPLSKKSARNTMARMSRLRVVAATHRS